MSQASQHKHNVGVCSQCFGEFKIQKKDGTLYKHGHGGGGNPCSGSYKPPLDAHSDQPPGRQTSLQSAINSISSASTPSSPLTNTAHRHTDPTSVSPHHLIHPTYIRIVDRIPRSARVACATRLTSILNQVCHQPDSHQHWDHLLNFAPSILAKPVRGGIKRNFTNLINRRLADSQIAHTSASRNSANSEPSTIAPRKSSTPDAQRLSAVRSKVEAGNLRAAVRILCSDETPAPINADTLHQLKIKHPPAPPDRNLPAIRLDDFRFDPIQVTPDDITRCLKTFPTGSSGGPDGLTAQHLRDMTDSAYGEILNAAVTDFVNLLLRGDLPRSICEIIFGGRMIALKKKTVEYVPLQSDTHYGGSLPNAPSTSLSGNAPSSFNRYKSAWAYPEAQKQLYTQSDDSS